MLLLYWFTRIWEGTHPGLLTQNNRRNVPCHLALPKEKTGGAGWGSPLSVCWWTVISCIVCNLLCPLLLLLLLLLLSLPFLFYNSVFISVHEFYLLLILSLIPWVYACEREWLYCAELLAGLKHNSKSKGQCSIGQREVNNLWNWNPDTISVKSMKKKRHCQCHLCPSKMIYSVVEFTLQKVEN